MRVDIHPRLADRAREARYSIPEAAAFIVRPTSTVRRWAVGHSRRHHGEVKRDAPLIRLDGDVTTSIPLSFLNLLELRFLASYRARAPLQSIRRALDYAASELGQERPLLSVDFKIYGKSLFLQYIDEEQDAVLLNASQRGQLAWPPTLDEFLAAVEYDESEKAAYRWWPLGRGEPVVIDTRLNGGLPSTARSGVRTGAIAVHRREGLKIAAIADDVGAAEDEVLAALQFERVAA
jgi:uncharacterized protein (DUF433 family)